MGVREDMEKFKEQMEALKKAYDQYFLGNTRFPPTKLREELERFVRTYSLRRSPKSVDNFLINSVFATYSTYRNYWDKIMKLIENGEFKRGEEARPQLAFAGVKKPEGLVVDSADNGTIRQIYEKYIEAKKKCGEDISKLSYEKVYSSIASQVPKIKSKFNCKKVEFKVTIEDGKAKLKAVPK
jgi:hypothetical protein